LAFKSFSFYTLWMEEFNLKIRFINYNISINISKYRKIKNNNSNLKTVSKKNNWDMCLN